MVQRKTEKIRDIILKNRGLITTTIIFFLLVNTKYYWEGKLGFYAFPTFLLLAVVYLGLLIALVRHICFAIIEQFTDKHRLCMIGLLTIVLALIFYKPFGLVNFDKLEGEDLLIAEREGAANCMTTLKLKDNFTFRQRSVCFGIREVKGNYHLQNDTIYFDNVSLGKYEEDFYQFAVIKRSKYDKDGKHFKLTRYKSLTDTIGNELGITKNELNKLRIEEKNKNG